MAAPTRRDPLPAQPEGVPWPTEAWPIGPLADDVDGEKLRGLLTQAFESDPQLALTLATGIVHRGRLVLERYGPTAGPDEQLISWSMGKSATHALVGLLTADGLVDVAAPAPVDEWAGDERRNITLDELLAMTSGLEFNEDYVDDQVSHVIEMLFGSGQYDVAAYARSFGLEYEPGAHFNYSSGTTNIVSDICGELIAAGTSGQDRTELVRSFLRRRLFDPIGMTSADPRFDDAGTFIGSSFLYCTTQDFLRFGYLYLRDGVWDGTRLLPPGWVDYGRTPVDIEVPEDFWYGRHWWLWDDQVGAFAAHGYEGQYILVVPGRDLVVCRLGKTPAEHKPAMKAWLTDLVSCFPE